MKACRRYEREGAAFLEHLRDCETCQSAQAEQEKLESSLASLGDSYRAPDGWKDRVRAGLSEAPREASMWARLRARLWDASDERKPFALAALATMAALVVGFAVVLPNLPFPGAGATRLEQSIRASAASERRGVGEAQLGDRLVLEADTGGADYGELRVYLNDAYLLGVPASSEGTMELVLSLTVVGSYEPMLVVSDEPIPPPASSLDDDAGAALRAGGRIELGDEVRVR